MAFLARILRLLLWLIVATWLGRKLFSWLLRPAGAPASNAVRIPEPKPLHRDPWCGTYVSSEISHTLEQAGQVFHFCSAECRERYCDSQRQVARA